MLHFIFKVSAKIEISGGNKCVHEADKSSGHREQEVEIYFRFNVYVATITLDSREYKKTAA